MHFNTRTFVRLLFLPSALVFFSLAPSIVHAQSVVLINTFGPGYGYLTDSYSTNTGSTVAGSSTVYSSVTANQFTVGSTGVTLASITLPMEQDTNYAGANVFNLDVETSVPFNAYSTTPKPSGVMLESFQITGRMAVFGQAGAAITVTSVTHPLLQPGVAYWVVASVPDPSTIAAWMAETVADTTPDGLAQRNPAGGTWGYGNGHDAFRVTGMAAAPEPSPQVLFGLGIFGLLLLAYKNRSKSHANRT